MSLSARGHLVRASLYSEVLLMLSRDYDVAEDRYNFLDFSPAERDIILRHFPIYNRVVEHLKISGRFFQQLNLTHTEFVYACAIGILRHYFILADPAYTDARKLLLLARHSLLATMRSQTESQELVDHKWNRLEALNEMLSTMSKEYREIAQQLQVTLIINRFTFNGIMLSCQWISPLIIGMIDANFIPPIILGWSTKYGEFTKDINVE
ncbi:unnamed protein product [Rodentolepis nana]|uniref:NR LBD domain-containing protein n=1 Tax=Rodentolepis nana TaxID=102285 RepID=A0A0R3TZ20_RODNA|nr:unnamed protein product [Rodentolepis nana]